MLYSYAFKAKTNNVCVNGEFECISVSEIVKRTIMSDPRLKQIKIKTGVLKRVGKEKLSCQGGGQEESRWGTEKRGGSSWGIKEGKGATTKGCFGRVAEGSTTISSGSRRHRQGVVIDISNAGKQREHSKERRSHPASWPHWKEIGWRTETESKLRSCQKCARARLGPQKGRPMFLVFCCKSKQFPDKTGEHSDVNISVCCL